MLDSLQLQRFFILVEVKVQVGYGAAKCGAVALESKSEAGGQQGEAGSSLDFPRET